VPSLPQLDGVAFRLFRGPGDYPHLARLITACSRAEGGQRVETAETLGAAYDHLERCEPARDLLVAEIDGAPVAYARVSWDPDAGGPLVYRQTCFVAPLPGGRGIGSALFAWSDARLREIAAEHGGPAKGARDLGASRSRARGGTRRFWRPPITTPACGKWPGTARAWRVRCGRTCKPLG